jgi:hypothetical protein
MAVPCFKCNEYFSSIDQLMAHLKYFHNFQSNSIYQCPFCKIAQFTHVSRYKRHLITHLPDLTPDPAPFVRIDTTTTTDFVAENITDDNTTTITDFVTENINDVAFDLPDDDIIQLEIPNYHPGIEMTSEFETIEDLIKAISDSALKTMLELHDINSLPRQYVYTIVNLFSTNIFAKLGLGLKHFFSNSVEENTKLKFDQICNVIYNPFVDIQTEHKLIKKLKDMEAFKEPEQFSIDNSVVEVSKKGLPAIDERECNGTVMAIEFQIKSFFEKPKVLATVLENMANLKASNDISNFINGEQWKAKVKNRLHQITIPFFLYGDDVQPGDKLGAHCKDHNLSAFYYTFPVIPIEWQSSLKNIFVAMIYCSKFNEYGNAKCLHKLVDIVKKLENEGLKITVDGRVHQIYLILGLLLGDNLGLNKTLGFSQSFSANYFCRFCKMRKEICQKAFVEDQCLMRTIENYNFDLNLPFKETGIHENSIMNSIDSFHVVNNYAVDIMHDIFEGIAHKGISNVILHYIDSKIFSLAALNYRKQNFDYGSIETGNRSVPIQEHHLQKKKLKMSSSEMMCFIHFLPLMIGNLVPRNDSVWTYLLCLCKLVELVLVPNFNDERLAELQETITKHNTLYVETFKENLIPKDHLLLHYLTIIRNSGPLKFLWCMRLESKHKELTYYTHAIVSRVNLAYSAALKLSFRFSYSLLYHDLFEGTSVTLNGNTRVLSEKYYYNSISEDVLIKNSQNLKIVKNLKFKGTSYKIDYYLADIVDTISVYKIVEILLINDNLYFVLETVEVLGFDEHFTGFRVGNTLGCFQIRNVGTFAYPPFQLHSTNDGQPKIFKLKNF